MRKQFKVVRGFIRETKAVSALEYAVLVGVIVVLVAGALATFGGQIQSALSTIGGNITSTTANTGSTPSPTP